MERLCRPSKVKLHDDRSGYRIRSRRTSSSRSYLKFYLGVFSRAECDLRRAAQTFHLLARVSSTPWTRIASYDLRSFSSMIDSTRSRQQAYHTVSLFLVTCAAWVNFEFSIKCVGASRSFPPPLPFLHYALLTIQNRGQVA